MLVLHFVLLQMKEVLTFSCDCVLALQREEDNVFWKGLARCWLQADAQSQMLC